MKKFKKFLIFFALFVPLYLSIVGIWAGNAVTELTAIYPNNPQKIILTPVQKQILLKIEDPTFYEHLGIDLSQGQGLTTITSVIARDIFLFGGRLEGIKGWFQSGYRSLFECCKKIDIGRDVMALILNSHMIKAPTRFHPLNNPRKNKVRSDRLIRLLDGLCEPDGFFDTDYERCDVNS